MVGLSGSSQLGPVTEWRAVIVAWSIRSSFDCTAAGCKCGDGGLHDRQPSSDDTENIFISQINSFPASLGAPGWRGDRSSPLPHRKDRSSMPACSGGGGIPSAMGPIGWRRCVGPAHPHPPTPTAPTRIFFLKIQWQFSVTKCGGRRDEVCWIALG